MGEDGQPVEDEQIARLKAVAEPLPDAAWLAEAGGRLGQLALDSGLTPEELGQAWQRRPDEPAQPAD